MRTLHVGLRVPDPERSLAFYEGLGYDEDFWTTWLTDPDGHRIELVQWPTGHSHGLTHADFPTESSRRPGSTS